VCTQSPPATSNALEMSISLAPELSSSLFHRRKPAVVLELWDYLAGWYQVETGLDNRTVQAPLEDEASNFIIINHARWDGSLVSVLARQLAKKSFRSYVLGNLDVNQVGACPSSIALPDLDRDRVGRYAEVLDQLTDPPSNRAPRHRPQNGPTRTAPSSASSRVMKHHR
jgi:hypothetical protein